MEKKLECLSKQELKQVNLLDEESRKIYLYKILTIVIQRLNRLEYYIMYVGDKLEAQAEISNIEADSYFDSIEHHHCYLLNVLGDHQTSSISYFKYRDYCQKKNLPLSCLNEEESKFLTELNKERNFCNHIPESILIEDICNIKNDTKVKSMKNFIYSNPNIIEYKYIEKNYFSAKHEAIKRFYFGVKHILTCILEDYKLLCGTSITIHKTMVNIKTISEDQFVQNAATNVQKLTFSIPDEWIEFKD